MTRFFAVVGVLAVFCAAALAVFFFGGFYDVAAAAGPGPVLGRALAAMREASIERHARPMGFAVSLDDPSEIQKGAYEFREEGCIHCHGAPGVKPERFAQGMDPKPPDLMRENHDPSEAFWVVTNGLQFTGMPAFGAHMPQDERVAVVALLAHAKSVTPEDFAAWSANPRTAEAGAQSDTDAAPAAGAPAVP
jgi:mono/diheme cytochrome c family protein